MRTLLEAVNCQPDDTKEVTPDVVSQFNENGEVMRTPGGQDVAPKMINKKKIAMKMLAQVSSIVVFYMLCFGFLKTERYVTETYDFDSKLPEQLGIQNAGFMRIMGCLLFPT